MKCILFLLYLSLRVPTHSFCFRNLFHKQSTMQSLTFSLVPDHFLLTIPSLIAAPGDKQANGRGIDSRQFPHCGVWPQSWGTARLCWSYGPEGLRELWGCAFVESDAPMLILGVKAGMFFGKPSLGWKISLAFRSIFVHALTQWLERRVPVMATWSIGWIWVPEAT